MNPVASPDRVPSAVCISWRIGWSGPRSSTGADHSGSRIHAPRRARVRATGSMRSPTAPCPFSSFGGCASSSRSTLQAMVSASSSWGLPTARERVAGPKDRPFGKIPSQRTSIWPEASAVSSTSALRNPHGQGFAAAAARAASASVRASVRVKCSALSWNTFVQSTASGSSGLLIVCALRRSLSQRRSLSARSDKRLKRPRAGAGAGGAQVGYIRSLRRCWR